MFQRSGPDHMLLYTVLKQKGARLNFTFTWESECEIQGKQKFTKILSWKKLFPPGQPGSLPNCPSPPLSSWPLHAEIFSSSADTSPPPIARAGQAPCTWGRLAALLVLKMVMDGKGTRTLLDVDVAW